MLRSISSCSGPSSIPNSSAICLPGNVALFVRRKKLAASRSRTTYAIGERASQPRSRSSATAAW
jgi:hypothetical protein